MDYTKKELNGIIYILFIIFNIKDLREEGGVINTMFTQKEAKKIKKEERCKLFLEHIAKKHKIHQKCKISLRSKLEYHGTFSMDEKEKNFTITLNKTRHKSIFIETFLHEVAHLVTYAQKKDLTHSDLWGKNYAKNYREWFKFFGENDNLF